MGAPSNTERNAKAEKVSKHRATEFWEITFTQTWGEGKGEVYKGGGVGLVKGWREHHMGYRLLVSQMGPPNRIGGPKSALIGGGSYF
jgi:hypothetical protein